MIVVESRGMGAEGTGAVRAPGRRAAWDEREGRRVFRGIVFGLLLSVPAWAWVVLVLRGVPG